MFSNYRCLAYSPNARQIVTGGDRWAKVWDSVNGRELLTLNLPDAVLSVCYSPDGSRILTGCADGTARLWEASSGRELLTFKGHEGKILAAVFCSDGRRINTVSSHGWVDSWEAAGSDEVAKWQEEER
jgi:WD40 repeat protein